MFSQSIQNILEQMCTYTEVKYEDVDFNDPEWYIKHTWTQSDESNFREWMCDYLYNDTNARKEVMSNPIKNKKLISDCVNMFIFNYGWKVREE